MKNIRIYQLSSQSSIMGQKLLLHYIIKKQEFIGCLANNMAEHRGAESTLSQEEQLWNKSRTGFVARDKPLRRERSCSRMIKLMEFWDRGVKQ